MAIIAIEIDAESAVAVVPAILPPQSLRGDGILMAVGIHHWYDPDFRAIHQARNQRIIVVLSEQMFRDEEGHIHGDPFARVMPAHEDNDGLIFSLVNGITDFDRP